MSDHNGGGRLQPARHVRKVIARICGTCVHGEIHDGRFICQRENGYSGEVGTHWFHTCDGYKIDPDYLKEK